MSWTMTHDRPFGRRSWCLLANIIAMCLSSVAAWAQPQDRIDFSRDILPILSANCFPCHGPDEKSREADLRLDLRTGAMRTEHPVIVPGNGEQSELVRRVFEQHATKRMPPESSKRQLSLRERETLRRWIDEGAVWGGHWAFEPLRRPGVPQNEDAWSRNPIDRFVRAGWNDAALDSAPEATKETLLRRVTLDLIGLPPTPADLADFLADTGDDAYERVVERLLASPHYGERWGRHWLDAARYADSTGFETDAPRSLWKYRDWVIKALNDDLPFDEFTIRQLAGDLLPTPTTDDRIATGFLLCGPQDGGSEPSRLDAVFERTNAVGSVFLGLTLGCAQCHSHKFDPISQNEYYGLFAFLNAADESVLELAPREEVARRDALSAQHAALIAEREAYTAKLSKNAVANDPGYQERTRTIETLKRQIPLLDSAPVLTMPPTLRKTTTFVRGDYAQPGDTVSPGVPAILPSLADDARARLGFARWLVASSQPLTPRVTVNRIWQQYFGRGLVETESDFGVQGQRPTHPELLDWLATEFVESGWRVKSLHRLIVTSATYRQSSHRHPYVDAVDPENRLLARQSRLRMEAETIRDAALAASGLFSPSMGGKSVFPFQHAGVMLNRATPAEWIMSAGPDRYRRGMYTHYWRLTPHPFLQTFDVPDSLTACTRRLASNTPLQALTLLNDPTFVECAEMLAQRVIHEVPENNHARIDRAFRLCLGRAPSIEEQGALAEVLAETCSRFAQAHAEAAGDTVDRTAWTQVCRVLLNLDEFVTRE